VFRALLLLCRDILRHPLPFARDTVGVYDKEGGYYSS
jgi:hypothetical protein